MDEDDQKEACIRLRHRGIPIDAAWVAMALVWLLLWDFDLTERNLMNAVICHLQPEWCAEAMENES